MAEREVFILEGRPFAWADVVLAELHRGAWAALEQQTRAGLVARRAAVAGGRELSATETTAAARRFRFERGLLAGEQLDEWLEGWGISLAEWREYLRRDLLRGRSSRAGNADDEVGDDEVSAAIGVEAICSGVLEPAAGRLAAQAALAPPGERHAARAGRVDVLAAAELLGISPEQCAERLERVERLEAAATLARAGLRRWRARSQRKPQSVVRSGSGSISAYLPWTTWTLHARRFSACVSTGSSPRRSQAALGVTSCASRQRLPRLPNGSPRTSSVSVKAR